MKIRFYGVNVVDVSTGNRYTQWFNDLEDAVDYCAFINAGSELRGTIRARGRKGVR